MACKVIYNSSNNVTDVFADNGAPSILWQDLKELVGNGDTAYDNYVRTQTKAFKSAAMKSGSRKIMRAATQSS